MIRSTLRSLLPRPVKTAVRRGQRLAARTHSWARRLGRPPPQPGWAVVATVDEPLELLCAFVGHYLDLGAAEIRLYLDRPDPEVARLMNALPRVTAQSCDAAYWGARGRPLEHTDRQHLNASRAYDETPFAWLLHCDADEFIDVPGRIDSILEAQPPEIDVLRLPVAERAFRRRHPQVDIFDGLFHTALPDRMARQVFGKRAPYVSRGMFGHSSGKAFTRTQRPYQVAIHHPIPLGPGLRGPELLATPPFQRFVPGAHLVHFDGMTPLHWIIKLIRKYQGTVARAGHEGPDLFLGRTPGRQAQIREVAAAWEDPEARAALLEIPQLPEPVIARLAAADRLLVPKIDPVGAARRHFPDLDLDFSAARMDAHLREIHADLLAGPRVPGPLKQGPKASA